jgi:hypothetical protein
MGTMSQAISRWQDQEAQGMHICVQGDLQEGDYITFAPVIFWISVHIFLVLSITFHWMTCNINFMNAFIQATGNA